MQPHSRAAPAAPRPREAPAAGRLRRRGHGAGQPLSQDTNVTGAQPQNVGFVARRAGAPVAVRRPQHAVSHVLLADRINRLRSQEGAKHRGCRAGRRARRAVGRWQQGGAGGEPRGAGRRGREGAQAGPAHPCGTVQTGRACKRRSRRRTTNPPPPLLSMLPYPALLHAPTPPTLLTREQGVGVHANVRRAPLLEPAWRDGCRRRAEGTGAGVVVAQGQLAPGQLSSRPWTTPGKGRDRPRGEPLQPAAAGLRCAEGGQQATRQAAGVGAPATAWRCAGRWARARPAAGLRDCPRTTARGECKTAAHLPWPACRRAWC